MRAMILAAGRGERMDALTMRTPKSLLQINGHYLIEFAIDRLKRAKIFDIVINISYLGEQIEAALGNGERYGVNITYSKEKDRLETGGGIFQALPLLGNEPFIVMSSDIMTDYQVEHLPQTLEGLAHLVMVDNPSYHPNGDFGLREHWLNTNIQPTLTYANIGVLHPELFSGCNPGYFRLSELLLKAMKNNQVTGEQYQGTWYNIGTQADLALAEQHVKADSKLRPLISALAPII